MPIPTDHPPSTEDSTNRLPRRRAIIGGVAGVALLVGPVLLANVIVPDDSGDDRVEAAAESETSMIALRRSANEADLAKAQAVASMRTTTTTAPPPPPTEPPPPPTTEAPTTTQRPTTTAEPEPAEEAPADSGGGFGDPSSYATWDALAECESGGNWYINTGNGYYGGLQFSASSWRSVGGTGLPHEHSRETQILMGQRLQARSGWGSWPSCASKLGLI
jgi:Transglycosylase-like domain